MVRKIKHSYIIWIQLINFCSFKDEKVEEEKTEKQAESSGANQEEDEEPNSRLGGSDSPDCNPQV